MPSDQEAMYDKLTSTAQSVLEKKFEGVEIENSKVVLTSDNEGCVEFICNSKNYRLDFEKVGDNEYNLSDEIKEEVLENLSDVMDAESNEGEESSSSEEEVMEEEDKTESEKTYTQKEMDEMKGEYESKMSEMKAMYEKKMDDMKMEIENSKPGNHSNRKADEESKEAMEEDMSDKMDDDSDKMSKEEEKANVKTANQPYYGDYAEMIINNQKTFI